MRRTPLTTVLFRYVQIRVRTAARVWTCWPTTGVTVHRASAVVGVNTTLTSARRSLV